MRSKWKQDRKCTNVGVFSLSAITMKITLSSCDELSGRQLRLNKKYNVSYKTVLRSELLDRRRTCSAVVACLTKT